MSGCEDRPNQRRFRFHQMQEVQVQVQAQVQVQVQVRVRGPLQEGEEVEAAMAEVVVVEAQELALESA